ncbi:MAG: hypothetical protein R6V05_09820 [Candidatus Brocadiia bacterium]
MSTPRTRCLLAGLMIAMLWASPASAAECKLEPLFKHAFEVAAAAPEPHQELDALLVAAQGAHDVGCQDHCRRLLQRAVLVAEESYGGSSALVKVGKKALNCGLLDLVDRIAESVPQEPARMELQLTTAEALAQMGDAEGALERLSAVTDAAPSHGPDHRANWLPRAARVMHALGGREQVAPLLERAAAAVLELKESSQADRILHRVMVSFARADMPRKAADLAKEMHNKRNRVPALVDASLLLRSEGKQEGSELLWQEALKAVEQLSPDQRVQALVGSAPDYAERYGPDVVAELLDRTEELARDQGLLFGARGVYNRLAMLRSDLGLFEDAIRLVQEADDAMALSTYQVKAALAAGEKGQLEQAGEWLEQIAPERVRYAGPSKAQALAELWQRVHPDATPEDAADIESEYLRDNVLMLLAEQAAGEGDLAAVVELMDIITPGRARQQALQTAARAVLQNARQDQMNEATAFAREAARELVRREHQVGLLREVALQLAEQGKAEEARQVLKEIEGWVQHWQGAEGEARILNNLAVVREVLGDHQTAADAARKAMQKATQIGCAGCRITTIRAMFGELYAAGEPELVAAALEGLGDPVDSVKYAIEALDEMPSVSQQQARAILRAALRACARISDGETRLEALMRLARAYAEKGLELDPESAAVLEEKPEPVAPVQRESTSERESARTHSRALLVFFTRKGCAMCREARQLLADLKEGSPYVTLRTYSLDDNEEAAVINKAICQALVVPERDHLVAPAVFSTRRGLIGRDITRESLSDLMEEARGLPSPDDLYAAKRSSARSALRKEYDSLALLPVLWAGLADGFNPCAFTVIIFFLSYLAYVGKSRTQIAWAGGVFTAAVFVTYFSAGLGLTGLVGLGEEWSERFTTVLYVGTAALAGVAAVLSVWDGIKCMQGRAREMTLSLPEGLKSRIRLTISRRARLGLTVGATAVLGALVALFELPCTGQMYLPAIMYARRSLPQHSWGPVGWLLLYNGLFILPLVIVFVAVLFGLTSDGLTAWFRRNMAKVKFAMAGTFALLTVFMIHQLLNPLG